MSHVIRIENQEPTNQEQAKAIASLVDDLARSGITEDMANEVGVYIECDQSAIDTQLGHWGDKPIHQWGPCLVFPNGRIKPAYPRKRLKTPQASRGQTDHDYSDRCDDDGHVTKYESAWGESARPLIGLTAADIELVDRACTIASEDAHGKFVSRRKLVMDLVRSYLGAQPAHRDRVFLDKVQQTLREQVPDVIKNLTELLDQPASVATHRQIVAHLNRLKSSNEYDRGYADGMRAAATAPKPKATDVKASVLALLEKIENPEKK